MNDVRKFVDFLVNKYIYLAFIISSFIFFIYESIAVSPKLYYIIAVALCTIFLYRYISPLNIFTHLLIKKNSLFFGTTTLLIIISFFIILSAQSLLFFGLASLLSFLYFFGCVPLIKPLRAYLLLKPFIIGIVYSILVCQIPMIEAHYLAHEYVFSTGAVFLFVSALAIVFDLGDVEHDDAITTFPKTIGIVPSKIMVTVLMILASVAMYYSAWIFMINIPESVAFGLSCLAGIMVGWKATPARSKSFYLIYVDGIMVLPFVLSVLFNMM